MCHEYGLQIHFFWAKQVGTHQEQRASIIVRRNGRRVDDNCPTTRRTFSPSIAGIKQAIIVLTFLLFIFFYFSFRKKASRITLCNRVIILTLLKDTRARSKALC
jgi:hypothetical protein